MDSTSQHHDPLGRPISTGPNIQNDASPHAAADNNGVGQLFNWDFSMGGLPSASDEMGFLGSIDFNDFQGWLTDEIL